jgi:hypothetical protein
MAMPVCKTSNNLMTIISNVHDDDDDYDDDD